MTLLPLNSSTLIYGSSDAGKTINQDLQVHQLLDKLTKRLNLREHTVGPASNPVRMSTPIDLEVHLGTDGRYYLLGILTNQICSVSNPNFNFILKDFSRTLPPQVPNKYFINFSTYFYQTLNIIFFTLYTK